MTFYPPSSEVLLFGGIGAGQNYAETWTWNGTSWVNAANTGPSPRRHARIVYDEERQVAFLFGGFDGVHRADAWSWNGATWNRVATSGPPARSEHAMAFDAERGKVVMFGGWNGGAWLGDTWEWDGSSWSLVATNGPPERDQAAMAYDPIRRRTVLFGGEDGGVFGDTWEWDGSSWSQVSVQGPAPRFSCRMAFDSNRGRCVLFGGRDFLGAAFGDVWEWDGSSWLQVVTGTAPFAGGAEGLAFDASRSVLVQYGGLEPQSSSTLDGTWELSETCASVYCSGNPQNTANIGLIGCTCADGSIEVVLSNAPPGEFCLLVVGAGNGVITGPGGALGDLCLGSSEIGRYAADIGSIDSAGRFQVDVLNANSGGGTGHLPISSTPLACLPAGQTWNFQYWHRDPAVGSRLSRALSVTFR